MVDLEYRVEQVIIWTTVFVVIDLVAGFLSGGVSGLISELSIFMVLGNFIFVLAMETVLMLFWALFKVFG